MNIAIIEDHFISRIGIIQLITENYKTAHFIDNLPGGLPPPVSEGWELNLIIFCIAGEDQANFKIWEQVTNLHPTTPIIIYCNHIKYYQLIRFLKEGAMGILFKSQGPEDFVRCFREVVEGGRHICREALIMIADQVIEGKDKVRDMLTQREIQIAEQLRLGQSTTEIAKTLHLALSAVSISKANIFKKMGVKNVLELREIMSSGIMY
jgi:DNA-binding NarL/FixJ family response regulator